VLYWPDSPDVRQVFQPTSSGKVQVAGGSKEAHQQLLPVGDNAPEYETAKEVLQQRIRLLQSAKESEDS
jgi:hypothetical protein